MSKPFAPVTTAEEINALFAREYPQLNAPVAAFRALDVWPGGCLVRLDADHIHLRAGGTVSGPALFTLADIGGYALALSHAGPDPLAVTVNLSLNFMRKAGPGPIDGRCRILKLGKTLMVFDCEIAPAGGGDLAAHATGTFSIPPRR